MKQGRENSDAYIEDFIERTCWEETLYNSPSQDLLKFNSFGEAIVDVWHYVTHGKNEENSVQGDSYSTSQNFEVKWN